MKVAIAADSPDGNISPVLGRAPYFIIYDTDKDTRDVIKNPYVFAYGGAGIQTAQMLAEKGVNIVVSAGFPGPNASLILGQAGISHVQLAGKVDDAIKMARKGELKPVEYPTPPYYPLPGPPTPSMSKEEEIAMLEEEKRMLERRIEEIKRRLKELEE